MRQTTLRDDKFWPTLGRITCTKITVVKNAKAVKKHNLNWKIFSLKMFLVKLFFNLETPRFFMVSDSWNKFDDEANFGLISIHADTSSRLSSRLWTSRACGHKCFCSDINCLFFNTDKRHDVKKFLCILNIHFFLRMYCLATFCARHVVGHRASVRHNLSSLANNNVQTFSCPYQIEKYPTSKPSYFLAVWISNISEILWLLPVQKYYRQIIAWIRSILFKLIILRGRD